VLTTTKTMEVKYFKVKHKVLKNSLHGQIWSDFENLNCQVKLEFFQNGRKKSRARQISVISGLPPNKKCLFEACLQEKSNYATVGNF
jgi:hypothetical protein